MSSFLLPPASRSSVHSRPNLKQGGSTTACRAKREETSVQIRKGKRDEGLAKRRNTRALVGEEEGGGFGGFGTVEQSQAVAEAGPTDKARSSGPTVADMPRLKALLLDLSTPLLSLRQSLKSFRQLLSWEKDPPTAATISLGLLPVFVAYLSHSDKDCKFEACWALTNVAATERTRDVALEPNCLDFLIRALYDEHHEVREQAGWCLGNIAGDCAELR